MAILIISATNRPGSSSLILANIIKNRLEGIAQPSDVLSLEDFPTDGIAHLYQKPASLNFEIFQKAIDAAEKIVFVVPEYNSSFPGVLKVMIDALRYPDSFAGKKALLVGLSAGVQGNALGLSHLSDILTYLNCSVFGGKVQMGQFFQHLKGGEIVFDVYNKILNDNLLKFSQF